MPSGGPFQCILGSGCNNFLIFPLPFFTSRFILNERLPGPRRPVHFCIPQFWFLLAGRLDVVDRLYLKRALVIACSVRWLCCRQMGTVNIESVLDLRTLLQLVSGEPCQHFSYYLYYSPHAILLFITAHCMFITASPAPLALLYSPVSSTVWGHKTGQRLCSFRCYSNPLNVPLKTWHSLLKTIFQKWSGKPGKSLTSGPPPQTTLL